MIIGILSVAFFLLIFAFIGYDAYKVSMQKNQKDYIKSYKFPLTINENILKKYPHLTGAQINQVLEGLKEYFIVCNVQNKKMVAMPSQVVDVAWHEFILFTKNYEVFCNKALGYFLHHTPSEAMTSQTEAQEGIKNAWVVACLINSIDPKSPTKMPLLFELDKLLEISDGFNYSLDCKDGDVASSGDFCVTQIGCASGFNYAENNRSKLYDSGGCSSCSGGGGGE